MSHWIYIIGSQQTAALSYQIYLSQSKQAATAWTKTSIKKCQNLQFLQWPLETPKVTQRAPKRYSRDKHVNIQVQNIVYFLLNNFTAHDNLKGSKFFYNKVFFIYYIVILFFRFFYIDA